MTALSSATSHAMHHIITTLHMHLYPAQNRKSSPSHTEFVSEERIPKHRQSCWYFLSVPNARANLGCQQGLQTSHMCGGSLPSSNDLPRFLATGRGRLQYDGRLPRSFQCPAPDKHQLLFSSNLSNSFPARRSGASWLFVKKSFTGLSYCRDSFLFRKREGYLLHRSPCCGSNFRGAGGVVYHVDLRG